MVETTKLKFPQRYSLGSIYIAPSNQPESWELLEVPQGLVTKPENQPINWDWLDEARGSLAIPQGAKVKLKINNSAVSELDCLASLAPDSIHTLDLSRTGITDDFISYIAHLTGLKVLELAYTAVSDQGVQKLSSLKNLHTLGLTHAAITNTGVKQVAKLTHLRELWLNGTLVDDEGMPAISKLKKLVLLGLSGTRVSEEGLASLYKLKDLLRLYMFNTSIDEDAANAFRKFVPHCRVKWRRAAIPRPEFISVDDADLSLDAEFDLDLDLDNNGAMLLHEEFADLSRAEKKRNFVAPMSDSQFWELIDTFDWQHEGSDLKVIEPCVDALSQLDEQDICAFQETLFDKLHMLDQEKFARHIGRDSYRSKNDCFSASWFLHVRCCAIANGRELYEEVIADPSTMPKDLGFRALCRVAPDAYKRKTGREFTYVPSKSCETFSNKEGWQ